MTVHKVQTFKGREFKVVWGTTHPEYSYYTFEGEERAFRDSFWDVKSGDVVFDVGASYGSYALTACAMGATVHAFEPERTVFNDLVRNVELNGWQDRCFPWNIGLWSESSTIDMRTYAPHWSAQAISGCYLADSLDNFVKNNGIDRIDWLKIDVEGAEEHVVRGATESIGHFGPKLIIECHIFLEHRMKDKIKSRLRSIRNFDFQEVVRDPCIMLIATPCE